MWVCPKCGRSFKNMEQSHYCGKPPATIEEYIAAQPEEAQDYLRQINAAIKASIPEAREKISWSMPTYWKGRNLIQFAASKRHVGLYPGPEAVEAFAITVSPSFTICGFEAPHIPATVQSLDKGYNLTVDLGQLKQGTPCVSRICATFSVKYPACVLKH